MKKLPLILVLILLSITIQDINAQNSIQQHSFNALEWRFIGSIVGTPASVVLGHPTKQHTFYQGASNGLWKTEDAGTYWEPIGEYLNS